MRFVLLAVLVAIGTFGCVHIDDVQATSIQPRYVRPSPAMRSAEPLVLVYDPNELPDAVQLSVPSGVPAVTLWGARSLVTGHLRLALESLFEHVSVTTDHSSIAIGTLVGTVHFIDAGLAPGPSGKTVVGTLEWSLTLARAGELKTLYRWGERTVGTREGAGAYGHLDPAPEVQGALEASLRALLKDMDAKGVASMASPVAGERKTVTGAKPLYCASTAPDVGLCFVDENACKAEQEKSGAPSCESKAAGSCFNATRTLEGTKSLVCAISIKDCEARRSALSADPDYKLSPCGVYRQVAQ